MVHRSPKCTRGGAFRHLLKHEEKAVGGPLEQQRERRRRRRPNARLSGAPRGWAGSAP